MFRLPLLGLAPLIAVFSLLAQTLSLGDLVLHYTCEEDSGSLFDSVDAREAVPTDLGHLYMIPGPAGFGEAVGLGANGSWQMSVADSAVVRNLANDFTVASWVYIDQMLAQGKTGTNPLLNRIIGDDIAWDADGWAMGVWTDGRVRFTKNGIVDIDLGTPGTFPPDQWVHFAATVSGTAGTTLYVNGVPVGSNGNIADCDTGLGDNGAEDAYALGRAYGAGEEQWFAGSIDDVRVYDHVLTEAEVQSLMVPPREPALVTNFNYAAETDGATLSFDVPIRNGGENLALNVTGASFSVADASDFTPGTLPPSLSPGEDGVFDFSLSPSRGGGIYAATLTLNSNDPERPMFGVAVVITVKDPSITAPAGFDFGLLNFGAPALELTAQIGNAGGTQTLDVSEIAVTGADAANFTVKTFPATVAPGASGELRVEFDAAGAGGPFSAQLEIASNDAQTPTTIVPLSAVVSRVHAALHLLSYFTFDSPTALGDDSGTFDNDGTPVGDAAYTASGRFGGALALDGDGDSVSVGGAEDYSSLEDNAEGFTAAAWINLDAAAAGNMRIFSTSPPPGGWGVGTWGGASSQLLATTYGRFDYLSPAGSTPAAGEWHHVAYVYRNDPISAVEYFVDGVSVGSRGTTTSGFVDTANGFAIGTIGIDGNGQFFNGLIDDLRIYNVELTIEEIGELLDIAPPLPLAIESISYDGTSVGITWVSQRGKLYFVYRSMDIPAENLEALRDWEELVDSYPLGGATGSSTSYSDNALPAGTGRAFYRVEEMPPN